MDLGSYENMEILHVIKNIFEENLKTQYKHFCVIRSSQNQVLNSLKMIQFSILFVSLFIGIKSEKCVKLAHMHSDAVDFPKTGKCPSLTQDLRPEQYPDFMMKVDKPRYR